MEKTLEAQPVSTAIPEIQPIAITPPEWNNRRLFGLLWPLIVEQLLIVAMGMVDMVMVSSVGEHAVSGISLVDSINFLIITAFSAMATGGSVVASQYIGRKDRKNACCSARQLIYISVFISLIIMIFTMCLCRQMLKMIYGNIADDVMQSGQTYFLITAISYPFLALYTSASAIFRSMGNSKVTMRTALFVNILNVAGNALFIYGFGLGVAGAALSTLIGRMTASAILIFLLMQDWANIIHLKGITKIKLEPVMIKRILNIGIPSGLETSMFQIGKILVTRIFTKFGTAAIASNAVAATINSLAFMPGSGYGMGLLIIAGQCIGAGDYAGVKRYTKKIMKLSYLTYFLININIFIFMNQIIGIFTLSGEAYQLCVTFLRIHCVTSTLFWCPSFVLPNTLKAAGDARYIMIVAASTMWLVRVCSAYLLAFPLGLGPMAVYIAMGADFLFRGIFFAKRWFNGRWMNKQVI
jgi:putative MATE family efflux protein